MPPTSTQWARIAAKPISASVEEERRVDDDVVEVLAGDRLMVGDHHVARREAVEPVALDAVADHHAQIGDEVRDAAHVLRDQRAVGIEERATVVADLVDHHVVRRALEVQRHLVGDRRQRVADDLERHRIDAGAGRVDAVMPASPRSITSSSPGRDACRDRPGTAAWSRRAPRSPPGLRPRRRPRSRSRAYTGQSTGAVGSANQTGRRPGSAASPPARDGGQLGPFARAAWRPRAR